MRKWISVLFSIRATVLKMYSVLHTWQRVSSVTNIALLNVNITTIWISWCWQQHVQPKFTFQNRTKNWMCTTCWLLWYFSLTLEKYTLWMHRMEIIKFHLAVCYNIHFFNISLSAVHFRKEDILLYNYHLKQYFIHKN